MDRKKTKYTTRKSTKNKEDDSLHFFRRPPESGLILHRSCVIYDGGRPPETGHVTKSWLLIGQHGEVALQPAWGDGTSALWEGTPPLPHFESVKVWYAPGSLRSLGAIISEHNIF